MARSSFVFLSCLGLAACSNASRDAGEVRAHRPPVELDVFATLPDAPTWASHRREFAVGIQSELRITGEFGDPRRISSLTCVNDACAVETAMSAHGSERMFLVTPKVNDFQIRATLEPRTGEPSSVDRLVHALDGDFAVLHPGAGPGTPFLSGMRIVWYVGPRERRIAWSTEDVKVTASPPFAIERFVPVDLDQDPFVRLEVRAPVTDSIVRGEVTLETGEVTKTFPLLAVPQTEIAALHVAPAPGSVNLQRDERDAPLEQIVGDRLVVPMFRGGKAWVVFETKTRMLGIAGAGECLPSVGATEIFDLAAYDPRDAEGMAPSDRPTVTIEGKKIGSGELLLVVGDVTGSAQVSIVEESF